MSAPAWHTDPAAARILCAGDDLGELIQVQCRLDGEPDFVTVSTSGEAEAALATEAPFDIIIVDQYLEQVGGTAFLERLRAHSPDAERLVIVHDVDEEIAELPKRDSRVMRVLRVPFSSEVLCRAVADALLRHRARAFARSAVPRVTPMGGNPCCTALRRPWKPENRP